MRIHRGRDDPYHRKLGRWFLVGILAALGTIRFAHASAVCRGDEAALILGPHGSGKSTLSWAALMAGWELVAEGVCLVDFRGQMMPFFMDGRAVLRLLPEVWHAGRVHLPDTSPSPGHYPSRHPGMNAKRVLDIGAWKPGSVARRPVHPTIVWLPDALPGAPLALREIPWETAWQARDLEDSRITALRLLLGPLPVAEDPPERSAHLWRDTFPRRAARFVGDFQVGALAELLKQYARTEVAS